MHELDVVEVKVLATGKTTSLTLRLPKGIQMKDGLNWNRSDLDTTVTSTPSWSSCLRLSAAVRPAKCPPSTSTFLVDHGPLLSSAASS